ncbi:endonuclease/exonuclease/phosphatase family protein [Fulvivirga sp. M361]|uniref:endonuclease/exonuclease/phosphatase family protein n=1 Tax=Fulvivirga sp. M361 TaxID=2594266 RepID=UPI00117AD0C0|nr:endonuclease/exonuclease/phosphatase family protein [Fulvivirga sp. M361]TRX58451.1 endonuclease/exonuclease/phosphatase family protein [Fulvivirga sp. M361]
MKWFFVFLVCVSAEAVTVAQRADDLRIMSYNIKFDDTRDTVNNWAKRKEAVIGLLRFYAPYIFGTQEGLWHQLEDIKNGLPGYDYVGVGRDDGDKKGEYTAIFYNTNHFEVVRSGTFWLSLTPEKPSVGWDAALPRICTWAEFRCKDNRTSFFVFNVHFDHVGVAARLESVKLLLQKIDQLPTNSVTVLMGDFNFRPDAPPYPVATESLKDSRQVSKKIPYGPEATFNGFNFHKKPARRIDYIFVSGGVEINQYSTLSDSKDLSYPSDHFPVMVDLNIHDGAE